MAKKTSSGVKDGLLGYVSTNVERLVVTSAEPANHAGVAAVTLGDIAFTSANITGPTDNGTAREQSYNAMSAINVDASGNATHVCLVKDSATAELLVVTTCPTQAVTSGNTMNTAAFIHAVAEVT